MVVLELLQRRYPNSAMVDMLAPHGSLRRARGLGAMTTELEALKHSLREFARDRDWGQFHSPKNLAAALSVEAGELLEHFQWISEADSRSLSEEKRAAVAMELADVFIYLLQLSDKLDVDLISAAQSKMAVNAEKYPVALAKGSSRKYTEL